jgi:hypothetical protein
LDLHDLHLKDIFEEKRLVLMLGNFSESDVYIHDGHQTQKIPSWNFGDGHTHVVECGHVRYMFCSRVFNACFPNTNKGDIEVFRPDSPWRHSYTLDREGKIKEEPRSP